MRFLASTLSAGLVAATFVPGLPAAAQTAPVPAPPAASTPAPQPQASAMPMATAGPSGTGAQPSPSLAPQNGTQPSNGSVPQSTTGTQPQSNGTQSQSPNGTQPSNSSVPQSTTGTQPQSNGTQPQTQSGSGSTPSSPNGTTSNGSRTPGAAGGSAGSNSGSGAKPTTSVGGGEGLPPPPEPAVLPAVPSFPAFSAPLTTIPNGELVGVRQPFVGLTLQDAIAMALARNTDLALSQSNRRIDHYQIVAARGAYDVNFQVIPSYSHVVTPVSSPFNTTASGGPVTTDTTGVTAQLRGLTSSGGQYTVGVRGSHIASDSAYNSYDPFYETALQFSITQPLGRGRAVDGPRLQIAIARINADVASSDTLLQASNSLVQVENAYYDLFSAWQNVAIQEEGLRNATAQAQSNARLAARGAVAPTDIVEANTQVNVFQDNVFAAIANVQRVQTSLKSLILANPGDPVWFANLVPTTPVAQVPQEPPLDALIASAIANRPEIAQVRSQRDRANVSLDYARDQLKPQADLALGATNNGFAGNPLSPSANPLFNILGTLLGPGGLSSFPAPPAYQTGKLGQSLQTALDGRFPEYDAQFTFSIPIGNHTARANYTIAQEQQRQVQIDETAVVQRIRAEAVNAIQGLREAQYRVIAARAARAAAQRVLLSEQRRFSAGTSTTYLVLQRQLDVANQEGRELQAQTDLDKAIVELNRVSGGIFAQSGVDIMTVGGKTRDAAGASSILPAAGPISAPTVRRGP